jgi:DNA-binding MarR family transcriptional regulator
VLNDDRDGNGPLAWGALLHVHATLVPLLDRELQTAAGISLAWYDVLLELNAAPDRRLQMSALGQQVVLSRTRVSRLVDELATAGLVRREPHPTDKRSSYAVITERGRTRLRSGAAIYLRSIDTHFASHLSDDELRVVAETLWRVDEAEKSAVPSVD